MKKQLCFILAALMCAGALTACTENQVNSDETVETSAAPGAESADGETEYDPYAHLTPPEIVDQEGAVLMITNWEPGWTMFDLFVEEMNGDVFNDALYEREQKVEDLYNASLEKRIAEGGESTELALASKSGDHLADVYMMFDSQVGGAVKLVRSWDILGLELSSEWWDQGAVEQYNLWGHQAAVNGAYSVSPYSNRHCYALNVGILAGIDVNIDLYDEVRAGTWTFDRMYELGEQATRDADGNGTIEIGTDYLGIGGPICRHYGALVAGAGIRFVDRDEEENLVFSVPGNERSINVLTKLAQLNESDRIYNSGSNVLYGMTDGFVKNRTLFQASYVHEVYKMRDLDFDIGVLPPPKYDETQDDYYSLVEAGAATVLPITLNGDDIQKTAILMDALGYYSYIQSLPAYIDVIILNKIARTQDASEMLRICFENSFYDLGVNFFSTNFKDVFNGSTFLTRQNNISSVIAACKKSSEKVLEKMKSNVEKVLAVDPNL